MKQSLNLKLGHKLKLTPRLQQAITLLQLSSMDLEIEIQNALENNPFLEEKEDGSPEALERVSEPSESNTFDDTIDTFDQANAVSMGDNFGEIYNTETASAEENPPIQPDHPVILETQRDSYDISAYLDNLTGTDSLSHYLKEQIRIAPLSESQSLIASTLVENINEDGYLDISVDEVVDLIPDSEHISQADIVQVLGIVQSMDPPGIGARDLKECLLIQLRLLDSTSDDVEHALRIVTDHFDLLSQRNFTALKRALEINDHQLTDAINLIRSLDPKPAARLDHSPAPYVVPDLVVSHSRDGWQVRLNNDAHSRLSISPSSKTYLSANCNHEDTLYFRQRHQEAKWFLQSLKQRHDTILRVATEIMRHQKGFLEHGERSMKPLTLRQVADTLGLHESTVSRATSHKYILSPRGTHELKYFFSSQLASEQGDALSSTAIQAHIRTLIAAEPETKPISDQKIADHFKSMGVTVARRTVAKYREQMHIPPSSQRKGFL